MLDVPRVPRVIACLVACCILLSACVSGGTTSKPPRATPSLPAEATQQPTTAATGRPNIVLITSDDQTPVELEWMPKTRRLLGDAGVQFDNMIATHPNCCPSRAQILTGQYAHNNGVARNSPPRGGFEGLESATTLPVWLKKAGYSTGFVGKYLHGYDGSTGVEPGWDQFKPIVTQPLSSYYDLVQFDHGKIIELDPRLYHTNVVTTQSREMVEDFSRAGKPFFIWSSYIAPHGSCETTEEKNCSGPPISEPKYEDAFDDVALPSLQSESFNEADLSDKPDTVKKNRPAVVVGEQEKLFRARLRASATMDDGVAQIVDSLERQGVLRDTVIIFTSDNGYMFGEHRQTGKVLAYEESIRVPLLMRGPGIPEGDRREQTIAMIDLAPTIAELADAVPLDWAPFDGPAVMRVLVGFRSTSA